MLFPKTVGSTAIESFLSNTFCIISLCSDLSCRWNCFNRKWCYTRLLHDFPLHPLISPFHFLFWTYKRDLAILTEWWQQRIAWWELLNAARQIIYIRKQHDVPRLHQVEQKAVGRQRNLGLVSWMKIQTENFFGILISTRLSMLKSSITNGPLQLPVDTFPRFVAIRFYFLSETLI
jgi:hypothetical protein